MITLQKVGNSMNRAVLEISGLSTDEKPVAELDGVHITNGSIFEEIDTGTIFKYNEDAKEWAEQPAVCGSGGNISLDYAALTNKPQIGGKELVGNKTLDDLGIQPKGTYLTKETDPTVPDWAKESKKPTYTADEVGALSKTTTTLPNPKKIKFTGAVTDEYDGSAEKTINIPAADAGKTGITGIDGREIELRKGAQNIEYRYSTNIVAKAQFNSVGTQIPVTENDVITRLDLYGYPIRCKFVKIKTVTLFGADEDGRDVANINCSAKNDYPFLGMFNPYNEPTDISGDASINGTMNISTAKQEALKTFGSSGIATVKLLKRIRLWVYFLDQEKHEVGKEIFVDFDVDFKKSRSSNDWKPVVPLQDITGTVTDEQVNQSVNNYMQQHPIQTVELDKTLTFEGKAADAKAVGNALKTKIGSDTLAPYMKTVDADKKYALKTELPQKGVAVADAGDADVKDKLNALLASLRAAGIIAQ